MFQPIKLGLEEVIGSHFVFGFFFHPVLGLHIHTSAHKMKNVLASWEKLKGALGQIGTQEETLRKRP